MTTQMQAGLDELIQVINKCIKKEQNEMETCVSAAMRGYIQGVIDGYENVLNAIDHIKQFNKE